MNSSDYLTEILIEQSSFPIRENLEVDVKCGDVVKYIINLEPTPRRIGAMTSLLVCKCNAITSNEALNGRFYKEYYQAANDLVQSKGRKPHITRSVYDRYGLGCLTIASSIDKDLRSDRKFINDLISCDRASLLPYDDQTISSVIKRVESIKLGPLSKMNLHNAYEAYFYTICTNIPWSSMDLDLIKSCFETAYGKNIKALTDNPKEEYRFRLVSDKTLFYTLGLPFDRMNFTDDYVSKSIKLALTDAKELIRSNTERNIRDLDKLIEDAKEVYNEVTVVNDRDSLFEKVEGYHSCDIVRYIEKGGKIFQFTRPEFESLTTKKINFLTGTRLPGPIVHKMKSKLSQSEGMPKSLPLKMVLTQFVNPTRDLATVVKDETVSQNTPVRQPYHSQHVDIHLEDILSRSILGSIIYMEGD